MTESTTDEMVAQELANYNYPLVAQELANYNYPLVAQELANYNYPLFATTVATNIPAYTWGWAVAGSSTSTLTPGTITSIIMNPKEIWGNEMIGRYVRVAQFSPYYQTQGFFGWGVVVSILPATGALGKKIVVKFSHEPSPYTYPERDLVLLRQGLDPTEFSTIDLDKLSKVEGIRKLILKYNKNMMGTELNPNQKKLLDPEIQELMKAGYLNTDMSFTTKMRDAIFMLEYFENKDKIVAMATEENAKAEAEEDEDEDD